jgi:hypothetical protein
VTFEEEVGACKHIVFGMVPAAYVTKHLILSSTEIVYYSDDAGYFWDQKGRRRAIEICESLALSLMIPLIYYS